MRGVLNMEKVVIVSAVRTAIGSFGGSLKNVDSVSLGATVVKEALSRVSLNPEEVNEVFMGNVLQAGQGQGVARQVALKAGVSYECPATTVNMICGSGLKTVSMGVQAILTGNAEVIVAGGTENMSQAPYVLKSMRWGQRMGAGEVIDTMTNDGLSCAINNYHMGITAENIADKWEISRFEQDQFAFQSQLKAKKAIESKAFIEEIVPVEIKGKRGQVNIFDTDEYVKTDSTLESLSSLRPAFKRDGTVTAGNASGINDGAAALVLMSEKKALSLGLKPMAEVLSVASAGVNPEIMGIGPVPASQKALKKCKLSIEDIDLVEANEAFASQSIAVCKELGLQADKVNIHGGAIALGHPIGCSGARILVTLLYGLKRHNKKHGLATLCIGGGMGEAMVIKRY